MAKKPAKRTKQKKIESLHHLISSLTYRATIGRSLLFTIILSPFFIFSLSILQNTNTMSETITRSLTPLLVVVGAFLLYDFLYVSLAYYYPIRKTLDKFILFAVEIGFLALLLLPLIWLELSSDVKNLATITLLASSPIFVLLVRVLMGVRASQPKARRR